MYSNVSYKELIDHSVTVFNWNLWIVQDFLVLGKLLMKMRDIDSIVRKWGAC